MTNSTTLGAVTILALYDAERNRPAIRMGLDLHPIRVKLLDAGVRKGTVSKVITIIKALEDGIIDREHVTSLNAAYTLVKWLTNRRSPEFADKIIRQVMRLAKNIPDITTEELLSAAIRLAMKP
jgi:hypothetical protein